ncbi:MAG: hypothetical protein CL910_12745 [Deltaproteobacteria bacterium]|nr:hypothetical protein [Deltaproteobacteria bacterium]
MLLVGLVVGLATRTTLQLGNTLHAGGRWESAKVGLSHGILGAVSFVTTRTALFRERLDLGAWHGHHELRMKRRVEPVEVRLRARLVDAGTLSLLLGSDEEGFDAVRLSRSRGLPSACLRVAASGRFLRVRPLPQGEGLDDGWHDLRWRREGATLRAELDGQDLGRCGGPAGPVQIALRSTSSRKTWVDDLEVAESSGAYLLEDFRNRRSQGRVALAWAAAVLLIDLLVLAITRRTRQRGEVRAPALLLGVHLLLALLAGLFFAAEWIYFGKLHPDDPDFADYPNRIEYEGQIIPRLASTHPPGPAPTGTRRVVFLGSSQTWGSGAARPEDTWVRRLEEMWTGAAGPGGRVEAINTGIPAFQAHQIRPLWVDEWSAWAPELVVIDLGNNDRDPQQLADELREIIAFNRARGIRTALVLEPNTEEARGEDSLAGLRERHRAMRQVAEETDTLLLDLHAALRARRDEGFLWWDRVHLTSFGHRVMAEEIDRHRDELLPGLGSAGP